MRSRRLADAATAASSPATWSPSDDGELVTRQRARAGSCSLGKTNTPEFGITGTTESRLLGPCRNPWNPDHIAGGSSRRLGRRGRGGHRAAGARQRRPGLDPHPGRLLRPVRPEGHARPQPRRARRRRRARSASASTTWSPRTVRDSAAMLDATGHPEPAMPYRAAAARPRPTSTRSSARPGELRIAWSAETPQRPADRSGGRGRARAHRRRCCAALGHERRGARRSASTTARLYRRPQAVLGGGELRRRHGARSSGSAASREPDELEPLTWAAHRRPAAGRPAPSVMRALQRDAHAEPQDPRASSRTSTSS